MFSRKKEKHLDRGVSQNLRFSWNRNPSKFCFGNPNMMFPKQNMLSQYPQQPLTEINAILVIPQLPFPWLAARIKLPQTTLGSSAGAAGAPAVPHPCQPSPVSCLGMPEPGTPWPAGSWCHPPSQHMARRLQKS